MPVIHQERVTPEVMRAVALGLRSAIVVAAGRAMSKGDQLVLREWRAEGEPRGYTGAWLLRRVTDVSSDEAVAALHQLVCFNSAAENEWATAAFSRGLEEARRQGLEPEEFWHRLERSEARARLLRGARTVDEALRGVTFVRSGDGAAPQPSREMSA